MITTLTILRFGNSLKELPHVFYGCYLLKWVEQMFNCETHYWNQYKCNEHMDYLFTDKDPPMDIYTESQ